MVCDARAESDQLTLVENRIEDPLRSAEHRQGHGSPRNRLAGGLAARMVRLLAACGEEGGQRQHENHSDKKGLSFHRTDPLDQIFRRQRASLRRPPLGIPPFTAW